MFGLFSISTLALIALYFLGFVQMFKGGIDAGRGLMASAMWAAVWPVSLWKVMNDLWRAPPPAE